MQLCIDGKVFKQRQGQARTICSLDVFADEQHANSGEEFLRSERLNESYEQAKTRALVS